MQFILRHVTALGLGLGLLLTGCSDDGPTPQDAALPDSALAEYGATCTRNEECASRLCVEYKEGRDKVCSRRCSSLRDCAPVGAAGWDCGEVPSGDVMCYPRTYRTGEYVMGHDCSIDGLCDVGRSLCVGQPGDADRYCADDCDTDVDCPPEYRCGLARTGTELAETKRCLRRQFCHPCVIDDQCGGPADLCVLDKNGAGYCGKACTASAGTCPPFATCENAGNNQLQCRHKAGVCQESFDSAGDLCDPCFIHGWTTVNSMQVAVAEEGQCKAEGYCYLMNRYSGESACVTPCAADGTCAGDYGCLDAKTLGLEICVPVAIDPSTGTKVIGTCFP